MIAFLGVWLWLATLSLGALQVDLGYAIYKGVEDSATGLTTFKGIRYAAPPTGSLRWQAPQTPAVNRSSVIAASDFGPICPQSMNSREPFMSNPGTIGDEDCLSLNVFAPSTASNLPVLVYIHGGGYGGGNGRQDLTSIINANQNAFIGVTIQYRLGAFGFLSSNEVFSKGVVNAGILDQNLALKWVQKYIRHFGGDASRVTLSGESAGGGSVMLHNIAYGGTLGNSLFSNSITASPYLPMQHKYSDPVPTKYYNAFATAAGCPIGPTKGSAQTTFSCLVAKDTITLQQASFNVSASGVYGSWAFLPVTDGTFIQQRPSQQLLQKRVNGMIHMAGNNANEGDTFVNPAIVTQSDLVAWVSEVFPQLTSRDKSTLLKLYPATIAPRTNAVNMYSETTFTCPSYWLAEAYSAKGSLKSYKYQYSVPYALHSTDMGAYFGPPTINQGPDFVKAFQAIWGNFVTASNPSISAAIANGRSPPSPNAGNPAANWPTYSCSSPNMINLNQTGGIEVNVTLPLPPQSVEVLLYIDPGLENDISMVNAYTFDRGRGARCDFWRSISSRVPE
ncbi:Carboxylic ester hydrolase [Venustampulla echinocandica]|uniref:Carboxylic ester hydrolase n=1 Tax=Venustampulla echinocandica TaxID=2656787 RepID=A0A370TB24_9HELO|nr:Carboxylic ester hydrolase [Venustampulla echinocandica]RDL31136.1 Carboxylic ester hydrolase [Venustampulla echinocandica]